MKPLKNELLDGCHESVPEDIVAVSTPIDHEAPLLLTCGSVEVANPFALGEAVCG